MILKITLIVLIISNILLWISHTKMKLVIGAFMRSQLDMIKALKKMTDSKGETNV